MRIRTAVSVIAAAGIACAITGTMVSHRLGDRYAAELSAQRTAWEEERAALRAALVKANTGARRPAPLLPARAAAPPVLTEKPTPAELIAGLRALRFTPGPAHSRQARQTIYTFEQLIAAGPDALPAIREFLAGNEDVDFAA